jgi:translation initiation factor 1
MSKKKNTWKNREGVIYSTNDDFQYQQKGEPEQETLAPEDQRLIVMLDKKSRGGKQVTLIEGFIGQDEDLKDLAKLLKQACGVGGSSKNGEILIQGDFREKVSEILRDKGYSVKSR